MIYRSKFENKPHRIVLTSPDPKRAFLRAADEYRRRRKIVKFMRMRNFIDYIDKPGSKKDFREFLNDLEELRTTLQMSENKFYNLVSEFLLQPNEQFYYNPQHLFGCKGSFTAEEYRHRIYNTMMGISQVVGDDNNALDTMNFITKINSLSVNVDVSSAAMMGTKNWYCIKAVQKILKKKGWTEDEFLLKVKKFYQRKVRKVYAEMLLMDLIDGQFDKLADKVEEKKPKKLKHIQAQEEEPWYKEWVKDYEE